MMNAAAAEPVKRSWCKFIGRSSIPFFFVGNGISDRCAAQEADLTFARSSLYSYCVDQDIPCHFFGDFGEILKDLKKQVRGVIFDLDGTLLEAHEAIYLGLQEAFQSFGKTLFPLNELKQNLKADLEATLTPFFSREEMVKAIPMIRKRYEEVYLDKTHFLDGAKEVLESLYREGVTLAVASNKFGPVFKRGIKPFGSGGLFQIDPRRRRCAAEQTLS